MTFVVTFFETASEISWARTSSRTCASVRFCCFSCARYFFSLLPKYCFLICLRRASTSLSVILMPIDSAFASRSACWTSSVTACPFTVSKAAVPSFGKARGGVCWAKLRLACAISASNADFVMCTLPTTAMSLDFGPAALPPPPQPASRAATNRIGRMNFALCIRMRRLSRLAREEHSIDQIEGSGEFIAP